MGNSFEKIVCGYDASSNWSQNRHGSHHHHRRNNAHNYCRQNHMQCQICKQYQQQQCHDCSCSSFAKTGSRLGGGDAPSATLLHVSSTPNLGGGYCFFLL